MQFRTAVLAALVLAAPLGAQQTQPVKPAPALQGGPTSAAPTPVPDGAPKAPLVIYQIDLIPTGQAFAIGKPRQIGNAYFFSVWPEHTLVKLSKDKVRNISPRTKDISQEVVYQVDLVPTGKIIAAGEPVLKGTTYTFKKYIGGDLMSLRRSDVAKITKLTGLDAFRAQQQEKGAARIDDLPMEGTGNVTVIPGAEPVQAKDVPPPGPGEPQGNWMYEGQPGVSDAWAPPSAVQASPGDVPKAAPVPTPQR